MEPQVLSYVTHDKSWYQLKGVLNVSSLSTQEGSDGSSNAPRRWLSEKSEKRMSLLQESHLAWPNNEITVKPLLTL
jgi:hypothetical protein